MAIEIRPQSSRINAIPTTYASTKFRSRLEAKWAAFFDELKWPWVYEPFDFSGYIPDFLLNFKHTLVLAEVKPATSQNIKKYAEEFRAKVSPEDQASIGHSVELLLLGCSPWVGGSFEYDVIGLLGENVEDGSDFAEGLIVACDCGVGLCHDIGSYICRRCGAYYGNPGLGELPPGTVKEAWAKACNASRWMAKA